MSAPTTDIDEPNDAPPAPPDSGRAGRAGGLGTPIRPVRPLWAIVIRSFAFVRKEVVEILRQPRLIGLLVIGPFVLLVLFGFGYGQDTLVKRAVFVGPADSIYAEVLTRYEEQLDDLIESRGLIPDVGDARRMLADGEVDVVVVFPEDPQVSVLNGERATIEIFHAEIDPIQEAAVEVAARFAIQEVNATVLTALASEAQAALQSAPELSARFGEISAAVQADPAAARDAARDELRRLGTALDGTSVVLSRLDGVDPALIEVVEETRRTATALGERAESIDDSSSQGDIESFAVALDELANQIDGTVVLDPEVLVRPFESRTENVVLDVVRPTDSFTPASLALLLQHLALTFAALSLVRDRRTGLFELMRVGPLSSIEIIVGKIFAYLLVGSVVAAVLVAAAVVVLGVSLAGSIGWLALMVVGVLLSSLSLGMLFAIVSKSESQAVQFAMLALLAGLFFGGFALPLESLDYPVRLVSWLLPVTHGISSMEDIMLRGGVPEDATLIGLSALVVGYGVLAVLGLRRRLGTGGDR